jgi:hypothetical protein
VLEGGLGREDGYRADEPHDLGTDVVHQGTWDALERAGTDEKPQDDRRAPADGLALREREAASARSSPTRSWTATIAVSAAVVLTDRRDYAAATSRISMLAKTTRL